MKRLARLAIFVALAFVFFKLEIPYPVPNYEFLKLDLGEAFLLLGTWLFPLEDSLMALTVWAFLGYLTGSNPVGMLFKVVCILATLIPYHYLKVQKPSGYLCQPLEQASWFFLTGFYTHAVGAPHAYASSLHSHWRNTSELVAGLPKLGCGRNVSKVLTESHQRYCDLSRTPVPF